MEPITITLPVELYGKLAALAALAGQDLSTYVQKNVLPACPAAQAAAEK